ncbi:MAG TPA: hypothetical protein VKB17_05690 [Thermoleophilaceae bacterium]|nr:hypothetical protein [Thermoleophilaceae bacterium]
MALRAGDQDTIATVQRVVAQERAMAEHLAGDLGSADPMRVRAEVLELHGHRVR